MWVCYNNILVDYLVVLYVYFNYSRWVFEFRRYGRELSRYILVSVLERFFFDLVVSRIWYFYFFFFCDWFNSDRRGVKYFFFRVFDVGFFYIVRVYFS